MRVTIVEMMENSISNGDNLRKSDRLTHDNNTVWTKIGL